MIQGFLVILVLLWLQIDLSILGIQLILLLLGSLENLGIQGFLLDPCYLEDLLLLVLLLGLLGQGFRLYLVIQDYPVNLDFQ